MTVQIVVPQPTKSPNSHYVSESLPAGSQEPANTAFQEVVTMENTGNTTWINGPNGYTLNLTSTAQFGRDRQPGLRATQPEFGGAVEQRDVHAGA